MDTKTWTVLDGGLTEDGPYLRRAQALLATRAELFAAGSMQPATDSGPLERGASPRRRGGRQLSLPIAREHRRPRARMVR